jgi:hypothetical protein
LYMNKTAHFIPYQIFKRSSLILLIPTLINQSVALKNTELKYITN